MDIATVLSIATALGVGTILGGWIERGSERRGARAKVLDALGRLEEERWAPHDNDVRTTSREFLVAAMVARMPMELARTYAHLALTAAYLSRADFDQTSPSGGSGIGAIDGDHAQITTDAARLVVLASWRPLLSRLRRRAALERIVAQRDALQDSATRSGDPHDLSRWLQIAEARIV